MRETGKNENHLNTLENDISNSPNSLMLKERLSYDTTNQNILNSMRKIKSKTLKSDIYDSEELN